MTLTFPRTDILDGLRFAPETKPFRPMWRQETSRTAGGITIVANMGPLLWQASYVTIPMLIDDATALEADLLSLQGGVHLFEGFDPRRPLPVADKVSALTGVTVYQISADRDCIRLEGLPVGFTLTKGDWLSVDDGTNLHLLKALETETANSSGRISFTCVSPYVRDSISVGDPVTLRYPRARFTVDAGSVDRIARGALHEVVSWTATQAFT